MLWPSDLWHLNKVIVHSANDGYAHERLGQKPNAKEQLGQLRDAAVRVEVPEEHAQATAACSVRTHCAWLLAGLSFGEHYVG